ncbi:MFS transporter [Tsukamurella sp. 8F]|uniref:MFS transporter n=1 Tax=unclassified Tsukamurella TaxID=2633480 RepID=UPI0023BA1056|nr:MULTISPECIES: MFS transporter [unclassified Tsukamurella]MDF0531487.1 MFS transporter [Tsukamurella sp. 8J]MDF0588731.1 MFS transporter [Tsukamurella sp. 8F]
MTTTTGATGTRRLGARLVLLFAITAGSSAGCLYYLQPLLHDIGRDYGVPASVAGTVISVTQVGYLLGLALVVPLGDFVDRRRLVVGLLLASGVALAGSAAAPGLAVLLVLVAATGVSAAAAQVVVPWASVLAAPEERGAVVGRVMSGLLIGILGSRILSGVVAEFGGWRTVLVVAALLQATMAVAVLAVAPRTASSAPPDSYGRLLLSVAVLIRREPVLRIRMLLGALTMGGFSLLWTSIAFLLSGEQGSGYHLSDAAIGLFGVAGIAGALGAPVFGRLADRGHGDRATYLAWIVQLAGWALLLAGGRSVVLLVVGLLAFDLGVQGVHLCNQAAVYALDPDARSRITTAYMVAYFLGGVSGSLLGGVAYQAGGWPTVCGVGASVAIVGLVAWRIGGHRGRERS